MSSPRSGGVVVALAVALFTLIATFGVPNAAAAARASGGPCTYADANVAVVTLEGFDRSVLCAINERRIENGVRALRSNGLLRDAAWIYATSQLSGQYYGHHGCLDGRNNCSTVIGRLRLLGYIRPGWAWIVGEALRGAHPDTSTPNDVVDSWMSSPLHRARLLKPKFRDVGVASVRGITDAFPSTDGVTVAAELGFRQRRK
jgi:uncharacterized protein YkwD